VGSCRRISFQAVVGESQSPRYVTNSAGNTLDVLDTSTNQVVQVIHDIELPHGVGFSADGSRVYVSTEAEDMLDVVDRQSTSIIKKIRLSRRPNNIAVTNDGSRVLVGIRSGDGAVDIIDTRSLTVSKTISHSRKRTQHLRYA
jgi:YVTN family beta-propeller protein